jgi:hypothetical protein
LPAGCKPQKLLRNTLFFIDMIQIGRFLANPDSDAHFTHRGSLIKPESTELSTAFVDKAESCFPDAD